MGELCDRLEEDLTGSEWMKGTSSPREDLAEDAWLEKTPCLVGGHDWRRTSMSSLGAQCNQSLGGPIRNCMGECCSQLWDTW